MTDVPPPPPPVPGVPPPAMPPSGVPTSTPPAGAGVGAGAPPPRKGLSTGAKVAIGCGVVLLLVLILMFACFGLAARFVGKKAEDFSAAVENQNEANETAEQLEREYAFTPPADGVIEDELADKFFLVTDAAWAEIEPWAEDMAKRGERLDKAGEEAGFGDAVAGMRGMGKARVAIVEALEEHDMAPSAYVWTGFNLVRAHEAQGAGGGGGVPERNLELARQHAGELAELADGDQNDMDKGAVLGLAYMFFPRADVMMPAGMDTLMPQGIETP